MAGNSSGMSSGMGSGLALRRVQPRKLLRHLAMLMSLTPAGRGSKLKLKIVFKRTVEDYGFSNSTYFP